MPKKTKPQDHRNDPPIDPDQPTGRTIGLEGLKFRVELQYGPIRPALYQQTVTELERQVREAMENVLREDRLTFNVDGQPVNPQMAVVHIR